METKNELPYLPNELIIQILLRSPVKSLVRFKCVCKSWFSIISDSRFATSQFEVTTATHTHRAFFISHTSPFVPRSLDLELSIDVDNNSSSCNPVNFMYSDAFIDIKGSCRGFLLLFCYPSFYLWNPSTGIHKNIPLSPLGFKFYADFQYFYGFGYHQLTDDYLVVIMSSGANSSFLEFFSFRANKWEQIYNGIGTHIHYSYATKYYRETGALFNGAIHWFAYRRDLKKDVIVVFDLMERKLLDMHLPDQFDYKLRKRSLSVFREFLSLSARSYDNRTLEIWVMKEYKVHSSWTKTHVLPTDTIFNMFFSPLSSTKRSDIVATDGFTGLVKYNDQGQLLGHHSCFNPPYGSCVVMYTESLLLLPGDNVQA